MLWYSLDTIVKGVLLDNQKPIHWYLQYLKAAVDCLGELNMDSLRNIKSVKLPVSDLLTAPLPSDYLDWVSVEHSAGQRLRPIVLDTSINRLYNYDDNGVRILFPGTFPDGEVIESSETLDAAAGDFGHNAGLSAHTFTIIRERGEIQLNGNYQYDWIHLQYIDDGKSATADAATQINPYAYSTIVAYINWKADRDQKDDESSPKGMTYGRHHARLRSRISGLTLTDVKNSFLRGYGAIKL